MRAFNAFVTDGRRIFVNSGALMRVADAEPDHRRARARNRPSRRRPSLQAARAARAGADADDHRHAARRRRDGRRRALGVRRLPASGCRRGRSAASDHAQRCCPISAQQEEHADRAGVKFLAATGQSAQAACTRPSSASPTRRLFAARGADPYTQSHPMPAERVAALRGAGAQRARIGTRRTTPPCSCATTWCAPRLSASWSGPTPSIAAIRSSDTSLRRALCPRHRHLPPRRPARRPRADRRADPRSSPTIPYFYELTRPGAARRRQGQWRPSRRCARPCSSRTNAPLIEMLLGQALVASNNPTPTPRRRSTCCRPRWRANRRRRSATPSSPWPMAARATMRRPISPPLRRRFCAATKNRARPCLARQDTLRGRHARLGQGRRHHRRENAGQELAPPSAMF